MATRTSARPLLAVVFGLLAACASVEKGGRPLAGAAGNPSGRPAAVLKELVPERPGLVVTPKAELQGKGWNCGAAYLYGDFDGDGRRDLAISALLPENARVGLSPEQAYAGYVLIATKEPSGAWKRLQFDRLQGVFQGLAWDDARKVLTATACQSDTPALEYRWDGRRKAFVGRFVGGSGAEE